MGLFEVVFAVGAEILTFSRVIVVFQATLIIDRCVANDLLWGAFLTPIIEIGDPSHSSFAVQASLIFEPSLWGNIRAGSWRV
jgi:hypothetical protein